MPQRPRLAIVCDYLEEGWHSMDLAADELARALRERAPSAFATEAVRPKLRKVVSGRLPAHSRIERLLWNADRAVNRYALYPWYLAPLRRRFDLFHVADHSYAQLVHSLPPTQTGVYCHDLDAFRCLLEPERERRPVWFRALARRALSGMQRAAVVFHSTLAVRRAIERHGIIDPSRLVHAPYGIAAEFARVAREASPPALPANVASLGPYLLHVGSCIPRKRIDVLVRVLVELRRRGVDVALVQNGGTFTDAQRAEIHAHGLASTVVQLSGQARETVAALYRGALATLVTSEAEGFGLPVVEALACGTPVIASDLPVLREVGGDAAIYCPVGDADAFARAVASMLEAPERIPPREMRLARAALFTWDAHAARVEAAYAAVARGQSPA